MRGCGADPTKRATLSDGSIALGFFGSATLCHPSSPSPSVGNQADGTDAEQHSAMHLFAISLHFASNSRKRTTISQRKATVLIFRPSWKSASAFTVAKFVASPSICPTICVITCGLWPSGRIRLPKALVSARKVLMLVW